MLTGARATQSCWPRRRMAGLSHSCSTCSLIYYVRRFDKSLKQRSEGLSIGGPLLGPPAPPILPPSRLRVAGGERRPCCGGSLPSLHRDPFDRILIAQALLEPLRLMTHDPMVKAYSENALLFSVRSATTAAHSTSGPPHQRAALPAGRGRAHERRGLEFPRPQRTQGRHAVWLAVDFEKAIVFIKWIGTHADYDRINVRKVEHGN